MVLASPVPQTASRIVGVDKSLVSSDKYFIRQAQFSIVNAFVKLLKLSFQILVLLERSMEHLTGRGNLHLAGAEKGSAVSYHIFHLSQIICFGEQKSLCRYLLFLELWLLTLCCHI